MPGQAVQFSLKGNLDRGHSLIERYYIPEGKVRDFQAMIRVGRARYDLDDPPRIEKSESSATRVVLKINGVQVAGPINEDFSAVLPLSALNPGKWDEFVFESETLGSVSATFFCEYHRRRGDGTRWPLTNHPFVN